MHANHLKCLIFRVFLHYAHLSMLDFPILLCTRWYGILYFVVLLCFDREKEYWNFLFLLCTFKFKNAENPQFFF